VARPHRPVSYRLCGVPHRGIRAWGTRKRAAISGLDRADSATAGLAPGSRARWTWPPYRPPTGLA